MNNWTSITEFEESLRKSFQIPPVRNEFKKHLYEELHARTFGKRERSYRLLGLRPVWTVFLAFLVILLIGTIALGPQRVSAAIRKLLGYIPGIGIVDTQTPIRILAEPVSITREGITITVSQAVITEAESRVVFGVSGVPLSAYPPTEDINGCIEHEYLILPDGNRIEIGSPLPAEYDKATFILPCIYNTLPGSVPVYWELPLRFIEAPPDFQIYPVVNLTREATTQSDNSSTESSLDADDTHSTAKVTVDKVIETTDGYILLGFVNPQLPVGNWLQVTGVPLIRDADGKKVGYSIPYDIQPLENENINQGGFAWVFKINGSEVKFPVTISFNGVVVSQMDNHATTAISVDVGNNPRPGLIMEINQELSIAGRTILLKSIIAESNGYSFEMESSPDLAGFNIHIEGYQAIGGGGGPKNMSLTYTSLPKGMLNIIFTNPSISGPQETWQTTWQPETARFFPVDDFNLACLNSDTINHVHDLPEFREGIVVSTKINPSLNIFLSRLNGTDQQIIASGAARAALNHDGSLVAYSIRQGIVVQNIFNGTKNNITGTFGRDMRWSPDDQYLAVVNKDSNYGIHLIDLEKRSFTQLTNLGYESIAGWSPDGSTLFYAIPGSDGKGFLLRALDVTSREKRDLFTLENSSLKAPMPIVSPDGQWIAYRAFDNASLYIKNMGGGSSRLVLDNPALAINGIAWDISGKYLGVSLLFDDQSDGKIYIIDPFSCEHYRLSNVTGEVNGIIIH